MSTLRPPGPTTPFWTSLVRYYRSCLTREQELALQVPADANARVLLQALDEHLISHKATTTIVSDPAHTQPILAYLNRRGRGITGTFIYGYPLAREGDRLYPVCYTEVSLEPGSAPQTVVLTRGARELLFNRRFLRFSAGLTDAEIGELQRAWLSSRGPDPVELLDQYLAGVDLQYDAVLFGAEGMGTTRGFARELQLMEQLRKDRLPDTIRIFTGEQGLPAAREDEDYLSVLPADADQVRVLKRWQAPFLAVAGPAGSGRSRTAANLVATAAAAGKHVLCVTPDGRLPDEFVEAFPGVLHIGSKEAWLSSLQHALRVLHDLQAQEAAAPPDAGALAAQSRELGRELDRMQAEHRRLTALAQMGTAVEPVAARVETDLARHPRRAWIESLARQVTAANAAQFRPEQLNALRELHLRALAWLEDSGSLGLLGQRRRTGQIKTALRQAGVPEFCHPEGDLREQVAGLGLLLQAYPVLLVRARRLLAEHASAQNPAEAAGRVRAAAVRKAEVDRQLLRAAWLRRAAGLRPHLEQIIASVSGEIEALEKGGTQRSVLSRQRFTDLLRAFPVVVSPHLAVAGVVPNEPELFDLLVLDDASQVSVPAFLPVLYRARRAVLLGDEAGAMPVSCLGPEEDTRLLGQVEEHNLAAFAYTEVTPLHRALSVAGPQALRLGGRYHIREGAQFVNVDDGQTLFPAPAAVSQAQNPLEARASLLQATRLIDAGVTDIALCSPFSGQVRLMRQLLSRLAEVERDPVRVEALRAVQVHAADEIVSRYRAVVISLVLAGGATPESLDWLNERSKQLARALSSATERAVLVGRRATVAGLPALAALLDGEAGRHEANAPGLQPEALGFLPSERVQHEACLTAESAVPEGLVGPARELYNRLSALLRQRRVLLAPRLPLAWTLGTALANLPAPLQEAAPTIYPPVTVLDRDSLTPLAVADLDTGKPGPAAAICGQAGVRYLAVAPGDWDRLRELIDG